MVGAYHRPGCWGNSDTNVRGTKMLYCAAVQEGKTLLRYTFSLPSKILYEGMAGLLREVLMLLRVLGIFTHKLNFTIQKQGGTVFENSVQPQPPCRKSLLRFEFEVFPLNFKTIPCIITSGTILREWYSFSP